MMCINVSHTLRHTRTPNTDLTHIDSSHTDNMTFHALIVFYIFERCVGDVLNSAPPAAVARALRALSPVIFCAPCAASERSLENDVAFRLFFIYKEN